jgi:two-component system CheB/CheR fusion protein
MDIERPLPDISMENTADFERLLAHLQETRGFDFSAYKRPSLMRRVMKRVRARELNSIAAYLDYLEVHPEEFHRLFDTFLINVTSFFRDPEAWNYVANDVLPRILAAKTATESIRVWVAGCASGEEAYSVAILLAEALGRDDFRERVKIYATDLDDEALTTARLAVYTEKDLTAVPPPLRERYFERHEDKFLFDRDLRRSMIFGRHDLLQDAPISRVDLLCCRNTIMYFNAEAQERVLTRFHFALEGTGFLFLGKAETLLTHANLFTSIDLRYRVFAKNGRVQLKGRNYVNPIPSTERPQPGPSPSALIRESALESLPDGYLLIDSAGRLQLCNERARSLFGLSVIDVGRPLQDLEISFRPVELRSGIEQTTMTRRPTVYKDVLWQLTGGEPLVLDVTVTPLMDTGGKILGVGVIFKDTTLYKRLEDELMHFNQELETAYEEVQSTNEELQTTNEELQSTVEELETTNEELHSTNEELETMNEELQASSDEQALANRMLQEQSNELASVNAFLHSILTGLPSGVVVVDQSFAVVAWNHRSEDMWGLRAGEVVGEHFLNLDIGLPVEQLRPSIKACLTEGGPAEEVELEATNRRGKSFTCHIVCTPLLDSSGGRRGAILIASESRTPSIA